MVKYIQIVVVSQGGVYRHVNHPGQRGTQVYEVPFGAVGADAYDLCPLAVTFGQQAAGNGPGVIYELVGADFVPLAFDASCNDVFPVGELIFHEVDKIE